MGNSRDTLNVQKQVYISTMEVLRKPGLFYCRHSSEELIQFMIKTACVHTVCPCACACVRVCVCVCLVCWLTEGGGGGGREGRY